MECQNIIIGAGPAGIQLGYFYKKNNLDYFILENENNCGSFFNKYPHSSKLISINKKYTGNNNDEFNMRHDWNSLLNDEMFLLNNLTEEYYPESKYLFEYINIFAQKNNLNIKYNKKVTKINKCNNIEENKNKNYEIITENGEKYFCKNLIIGTGLSKMNIPDMIINTEKKIKHYGEFEKNYFTSEEKLSEYKNKKVLIIGGGNASYELANILNKYTSSILIFGKTRELSIVSHYVGDLRSIYYPFFDTFSLKSLNAIDQSKLDNNFLSDITIQEEKNKQDKNYGKLYLEHNGIKIYENKNINYYDEVIFCTGWQFDSSIFNFKVNLTINNKYPQIKNNFESINNENLFFIGSLMHSIDFRKSSGGFIHGFRYLIKLFTQINYNNLIPFEIKKFSFDGTLKLYDKLSEHIMYRINNSSSLYQMFGTMCDLFYYDSDKKELIYYNDLTIKYINEEMKNLPKYYNIIMLNYGEKQYDVRKIFDFNKYNPSFIHPEILMFENIKEKNDIKLIDRIIIEEDLFADFTGENFYKKILRSLKGCNLLI